MELGLGGKVALVTGASRGIGQAHRAVVCGRGLRPADHRTGRGGAGGDRGGDSRPRAARPRPPCSTCAREGSEKALVETVRREFGQLDILVNNAGATRRGRLLRADRRRLAGRLCAEVLRPRAARPRGLAAAQGAQRLAGHASAAPAARSRRPSSPSAARSTPRCAAFTKASPTSARADGVQVNCVHPSLVETERQWKRIPRDRRRPARRGRRCAKRIRQEFGISRYGKVEDLGRSRDLPGVAARPWMHGATIDLDGGELGGVEHAVAMRRERIAVTSVSE